MVVEFVISCRTGENGCRSLDGDRVYVNIVIISVHLHDLAWTLTCIDGYDEAAHGSCGSPVYVEDNQEYHKGHSRGDDVLTASRGHDLLNKEAVEHSGCRMPSKTCPQSSMNVASVSHLWSAKRWLIADPEHSSTHDLERSLDIRIVHSYDGISRWTAQASETLLRRGLEHLAGR